MKKSFIIILLSALSFAASALPFSAGATIGTNMNAPSGYGYALDAGVHADYEVIKNLKAGLDFSVDFIPNRTISYVPSAYAKWYLPFTFGQSFTPFVQANAGISVMYVDAVSDATALFCGGVSAGMQFKTHGIYIEPRVSFGFPYLWGTNLTIGYSFK